ncbi:MAG TPA: glycoside hydrolase 43 family protein [Longimicrobiaceae bacterium]|nr:glycoside hydrolase 43 family protein [Longimicrobiaceae bacterium]
MVKIQVSGLLLAAVLPVACVPAPSRVAPSSGAEPPPAWSPDAGNGRYRNPIVFADYSDPDVIRVGDDFYMTSSSFNAFPALPILHSRDLVHWTIVNHAIDRFPDPAFDTPQHGNGVWAPSLRYHDGWFWIFYGDPDRGIYMVKTRDIRDRWEPPVLVREAKGWIDPAPLWDDDGNAYLVHAFARSRSGIKHVLHVNRMSPDGTRLLDEGRLVFGDSVEHPTLEGPKLYKRNGWYYIFAPAGGVPTGWQTVLRSRSVYGPYEDRIVLARGSTPVNGPHQGGYVELENGEGWFVHFQDREAYGRIVHLQPVAWKDDWPVMGHDPDGDGTGEPVLEYRMPDVGATHSPVVPQTTDEFEDARPGLQWQWAAHYRESWFSLADRRGWLRLRAQPMPHGAANLWPVPNLLLQMLPAPEFQATTRISFAGAAAGERAGLVVTGMDYAWLGVERTAGGVELVQARAVDAPQGAPETVSQRIPVSSPELYLRVTVENPEGHQALCRFWYSLDGRRFQPVGPPFPARPGRWIGARVGLFALRPAGSPAGGHADFEFFRIGPRADPSAPSSGDPARRPAVLSEPPD